MRIDAWGTPTRLLIGPFDGDALAVDGDPGVVGDVPLIDDAAHQPAAKAVARVLRSADAVIADDERKLVALRAQ